MEDTLNMLLKETIATRRLNEQMADTLAKILDAITTPTAFTLNRDEKEDTV